jgi:hypothetical protein
MRRPDSEDTEGTSTESTDGIDTTGSAQTGSLADGFGGDSGEPGSGGGDDAFGTGWPQGNYDDGGDQPSFLTDDETGDLGGDDLSPYEFETDYVPDTDTDWDITGDGVVDHADLHEATTALSDFHVDQADGHHAHHIDGGHAG